MRVVAPEWRGVLPLYQSKARNAHADVASSNRVRPIGDLIHLASTAAIAVAGRVARAINPKTNLGGREPGLPSVLEPLCLCPE